MADKKYCPFVKKCDSPITKEDFEEICLKNWKDCFITASNFRMNGLKFINKKEN